MSRIEQSRAPLSELNGVVAVAAHKSFRRAATALGVSPSALSHAVASLEQRVGVKLFHRTTRSVSLSEAGERFLERVRPALRELEDAIETVNDFRDTPRGTLRINAATIAVERIFVPVILPFLARYPEMSVEIVNDGRLVDIVAGGFDAGIRLADLVPRDMVAIPCSPPLRFVVVGSPEYFTKHPRPRSPGDLHAHACVRRRMPSGARLPWEFEKNGEAAVIEVPGPLRVDADELALAAALHGYGLAWVNERRAAEAIADGRLETVLEDWCAPFGELCLYYAPHRHVSVGLRAFIAMLRASGVAKGETPRRHERKGTARSKKPDPRRT
ncbi:MAG TPA: LysR family transcriptional regulator [Polyangiaceae bacterium]|jgi:DNA-binding transcriptional LysR family regulator|nr:LysR family transcriptional regulator [Polyangiaceae bacterium]